MTKLLLALSTSVLLSTPAFAALTQGDFNSKRNVQGYDVANQMDKSVACPYKNKNSLFAQTAAVNTSGNSGNNTGKRGLK
jgi:endonuclease/exonuclease/phosphatase family metal-dependent hydrolase